ncbi:hypothetical protein KAR91_16155 [Candidatus Pacearchaeota archaeon]|nr:hypothetical protein [Candidatus Pacearchaeota archaeon]
MNKAQAELTAARTTGVGSRKLWRLVKARDAASKKYAEIAQDRVKEQQEVDGA